jgi:hypothetical protein
MHIHVITRFALGCSCTYGQLTYLATIIQFGLIYGKSHVQSKEDQLTKKYFNIV